MDAAKRRFEVLAHVAERQIQRRSPSDQYVVVVGVQTARVRQPDQLPQAAPHPVALDRAADLPRHRKTDPYPVLVRAPACLQHERPAGRPHCARGSPKV
jgi:hypothetical protein